jgi:hypothetical protein
MNTRKIAGWGRFLLPGFLGFSLLTPHPVCGQSAERLEPPEWFAGDAHVHRSIGCSRSNAKEMLTPQELLDGMKANNLAVVSALADIGNGEGKYQEKDIPLINGQDNPVSPPQSPRALGRGMAL